ncbi:MAG: hypothetical protein JWL81_2111 [Verrucomicrobiales bacterium]|nr:hypothetical protein [Verrucomicrobiales bacterium]
MIHALHGNFGLPSDWDACLPPGLAATAWNLWEIRRHHPTARTLTGFAAWFNDRVQSLPSAGPRTLTGYSLGGRLALHVLLDRPALWSRVVILSAHPGLTDETDRVDRLRSDATWAVRCRSRPWEEVLDQWNSQSVLTSGNSTASPPRDAGLTEPWREEIAGAFLDWSLGAQENPVPGLSSLTTLEGLWLAGGEDEKFTAVARETVARLPGFRLRIQAGAGHRLLSEAPDAVRQCLAPGHSQCPESETAG